MNWPSEVRRDAETLWWFHRLDHALRPVDVAVGLGSHDDGVPIHVAELYRRGLFPAVIFTGANSPTTVDRFPHGEAVGFREIALEHGVPRAAIRVETTATTTVENIRFTRDLLAEDGITPRSVLLVSRPYQQRRAHAVATRIWPGVTVLCSAARQDLDTYVAHIGDADRVVTMLVGDTQRLELQARSGEIAPQEIPDDVRAAYSRLVAAGYTARLLRPR